MPETATIHVNGKTLEVPSGVSVAAAIFISGESCFRHSISGEPRAALCGMGICLECRVTINGRQHCRSCQMVVEEGMAIRTS